MFSRKKLFLCLLSTFLLNSYASENDNFKTENSKRRWIRREIGYFWHLSDVFFDPTYSPLAAPENDCHITNSEYFARNCGFFGELGQCSAFGLVETIAKAMKSKRWQSVAPDFCIFTGNLRCPNVGDRPEAIYETMNAFITDIQNAGFVDVYPSYGWYDYQPYGHHPLNLTTLHERVKNMPDEERTPSISLDSAPNAGYFSRGQLPQNRIRVIVLNTNFYVRNHIDSTLSDPAGQWGWLTDQLEGCRTSGQKAFIVMSIPPGIDGDDYERGENRSNELVWRDRHNQRYIQIIGQYRDTIAAQFGGHRHEDTFRFVYDKEGKAVSVVLLAPAITPRFGSYPAMRIYMYDKNSGQLLDFVQYYFNLTKANLDADMTSPEKYWKVDYSLRDFYRIRDATTLSFVKLVRRFRKDDFLFQRYHNKAMGHRDRKRTCEGRCRLISLCEITSIDLEGFRKCLSGQFATDDQRHVRRLYVPPEALRDRLVHRSLYPTSASSATSADHLEIVFLCFSLRYFSSSLR